MNSRALEEKTVGAIASFVKVVSNTLKEAAWWVLVAIIAVPLSFVLWPIFRSAHAGTKKVARSPEDQRTLAGNIAGVIAIVAMALLGAALIVDKVTCAVFNWCH